MLVLHVPAVLEATMAEMMRHAWPGNFRELKSAAERIVITARAGTAGSFSPDMRVDDERLLSLPAGAGRLREEMKPIHSAVSPGAWRWTERKQHEGMAAHPSPGEDPRFHCSARAAGCMFARPLGGTYHGI